MILFRQPTAPVKLSFAVDVQAAPAEGAAPKTPRFRALAYTGSVIRVEGWERPVAVDLSGLAEGKNLVANLDHDRTKRVGHVDTAENDGRTLTLSGALSAATPWRDEVLNSAREGFTWQASIEASPGQERGDIEAVKPGETVFVNGQQIRGPAYVVRRGTLKGFAFVSHGADDSTAVDIAAQQAAAPPAVLTADYQELFDSMLAMIRGAAPVVQFSEFEADEILATAGIDAEQLAADLQEAIDEEMAAERQEIAARALEGAAVEHDQWRERAIIEQRAREGG